MKELTDLEIQWPEAFTKNHELHITLGFRLFYFFNNNYSLIFENA